MDSLLRLVVTVPIITSLYRTMEKLGHRSQMQLWVRLKELDPYALLHGMERTGLQEGLLGLTRYFIRQTRLVHPVGR